MSFNMRIKYTKCESCRVSKRDKQEAKIKPIICYFTCVALYQGTSLGKCCRILRCEQPLFLRPTEVALLDQIGNIALVISSRRSWLSIEPFFMQNKAVEGNLQPIEATVVCFVVWVIQSCDVMFVKRVHGNGILVALEPFSDQCRHHRTFRKRQNLERGKRKTVAGLVSDVCRRGDAFWERRLVGLTDVFF